MIGGRRYREVKETKTELNEFGQQIKKHIVKLQPLDDNVKKVEPTSSLSSQGGISGASTNYGGFTGGYNAGGNQGGYSAGTQGGFNGYSAQSGYRQ